MKTFFKELFEYNFNFNQKTLNVLAENHQQISQKLLQLHSHIINVHGLWNSKIIPAKINYKPWDMYSVEQLMAMDHENLHSSIAIIAEFDLNFQIHYLTSNGQSHNDTIRDILFQIINHSTYHRGQIATEFRQCNLEPLLTDWIFHKWTS